MADGSDERTFPKVAWNDCRAAVTPLQEAFACIHKQSSPDVFTVRAMALVATLNQNGADLFLKEVCLRSIKRRYGADRMNEPAIASLAHTMLVLDPPDHTRLRGLVQRAFTPRRVNELRPFIESKTADIIARHLDGAPFDAVQELAWAIPVAVICEMLNIPEEDHERFQSESAMLARGLDPDFLLSDEDRAARDQAIMHFGLYFHELFAKRRAEPGDDLLSALVAARDGEDRLSEGELLSTAILLLVAGHETTMNLISGSMLALAKDPVAQAHLRAHPELDRTATDEFLRLVAPVQLTGRTLTEDIEVDGHVLDKGSFVFILIGGANRDPAVFEDPTTLRLDREPNPHLGFGFGMHHCLGAPLARLESSIVMRQLLDATTEFTLADSEIRYRPNVILRGLETLSLSLRP